MNILFVANHNKTMLFYYVAKELSKFGHKVFWLSPGGIWANWLINEGVAKEDILIISDYFKEWSDNSVDIGKEDYEKLKILEQINKWSINDMIMMDRLLRLKPYSYALKYLATCNNKIQSFLKQRNINIVFQESTWAIELLMSQICNFLRIKIFSPESVRIPYDRFAFFDSHLANKLATNNQSSEIDISKAESIYEEIISKSQKPEYFSLNNKPPKNPCKYLKSFFNHLRLLNKTAGDETYFPITYMIKERTLRYIRYLFIKLFYKKKPYPKGKPYVLFPLHVQPESSIDVRASYYSNQLEIIKNLSRSLPITHILLVKEHSNFLGSKPLSFYSACRKIPGVYLVDPFYDSIKLIKAADLVISITGTASLEAFILGVKTRLLSKTFFSDLMNMKELNIYNDGFSSISKILEEPNLSSVESRQRGIDIISQIIANSYKGIISDSKANPKCMLDDNIKYLVEAFNNFLATMVVHF